MLELFLFLSWCHAARALPCGNCPNDQLAVRVRGHGNLGAIEGQVDEGADFGVVDIGVWLARVVEADIADHVAATLRSLAGSGRPAPCRKHKVTRPAGRTREKIASEGRSVGLKPITSQL